jgi:hypothetical protein
LTRQRFPEFDTRSETGALSSRPVNPAFSRVCSNAQVARPLLAAASALLPTTVFDNQLHLTMAEMSLGPAGVSAGATQADGV